MLDTDLLQRDAKLVRAFEDFVRDSEFPCVGAKSALNKEQMQFYVANDICSGWDDLRIWPRIAALAAEYRRSPELFQTLVVLFRNPRALREKAFEQAMWARLQSLSDKDEWLGEHVDPRVSADPDDPHFAVSFAGEGFFIVGLHAQASRPARRFPHPAMVFNLHDQFERLRADGLFDALQETIRQRDQDLAGSINPMLAEHGEESAARQYSGRAVEKDWACPFSRPQEDG